MRVVYQTRQPLRFRSIISTVFAAFSIAFLKISLRSTSETYLV